MRKIKQNLFWALIYNSGGIPIGGVSQFKCPTCDHLLGREEYEYACKEFNKKVEASCDEFRNIF